MFPGNIFFLLWILQTNINKFIYQKKQPTQVNMEICPLSHSLPGPAETGTSDTVCLLKSCLYEGT